MKKIDLHIHTIPTISDSHFDFDLSVLQRYVEEAELDAIALTNHNIFDRDQYRVIKDALNIPVFPGIEVDVARGHLLMISDDSGLDFFEERTGQIAQHITTPEDSISLDDLQELFPDLNKYLLIPHYEKKPAIKGQALERIIEYVSAGEVDSPKKFIRAAKDETKLPPVLFSDARMSCDLDSLPTRQTYVDCGEVTLRALKNCLQNKGKVALSAHEGNQLFQIFENGQMLSTGLNVLLGERSSGKTYTLNRINDLSGKVKYITQFSLVQQDDDFFEREFDDEIKKQRSQFVENYLSKFKAVLDDVMNVNLSSDSKAVDSYLDSVLKAAEEADKKDTFSRTALFSEAEFSVKENEGLRELIQSVRKLIDNVEYRDVIDARIDPQALKALLSDLIYTLRQKELEKKKKKLVNGIIRDVREGLKMRTSAVQVEDVDLYTIILNKKKIERFSNIVKSLQKEATISEESIQGFCVIAKKGVFPGAMEIKRVSGVKTGFKEAFSQYGSPYEYLQCLLSDEKLTPSELYKLFARITYKVINRDGYEVSGGERSEFRLLQKIRDAQNYDMLLIDEPESSFDNMFLKSDVNQIIREIADSMPVVVVTHNSTVGASIGADYVLYASKEVDDDGVSYRIYSGHPTDYKLTSVDGLSVDNHEVMMKALEAGAEAYEKRKRGYEVIRN